MGRERRVRALGGRLERKTRALKRDNMLWE